MQELLHARRQARSQLTEAGEFEADSRREAAAADRVRAAAKAVESCKSLEDRPGLVSALAREQESYRCAHEKLIGSRRSSQYVAQIRQMGLIQ